MTDTAQNIVDQVLEEVENTPGVGVENPLEVANQALQETLVNSVVPEEYWSEIISWVAETGLDSVYLDSRDRVGAWWALERGGSRSPLSLSSELGIFSGERCIRES